MHLLLATAYLYAAATTNRVAALPATAPRLDGGGTVVNLVAAPQSVREACGYYLLDETKPATVGAYYTRRGYERVDAHSFRVVWEAHPITPPVTRYSGWAMYKAIKAEGYGEAFDALMKADIGVMIAFVRPQYFLSNDPDFTAMVDRLCAALHITAEARTRILAASVDEKAR